MGCLGLEQGNACLDLYDFGHELSPVEGLHTM